MNAPFIKNIRVIKRAIEDRKLVVFAGAGVSIDSGLPLWQTLVDSLRDDIEIPENETGFQRIAPMYINPDGNQYSLIILKKRLKHVF